MHMDLKKACSILVVESNALSLAVITKAYKKLALKYHPDKCKEGNAQEKFTEIQKAFNYLKTALPKKDKNTKNSSKTQEPESPQQPEPNEFKITLTLEEIFEGCRRTEKVAIKVVDANGVEKKENKQLTVNVKRGSIADTRIVVEKEGDRYHGKIPANVVFIVCEHPHELFKRARFDLVYTAKLTTEQACAKHVTVPTIDGRQIRLPIKELITQSTERREANLGLPIPTGNGKRGDLVIKFDIIYEKDKKKDPPVKYDLLLTLEQLLKGCSKKMKIKRTVIDPFDGTELQRDGIIEVIVPSGADSGTQFTFEKQGDQRPETIPADIIVTVKQKTHSKFIRSEADIKHTVLVSEDEVRTGTFTVDVPTLDGDTIPMVIVAGMNSKVFQNRGLPLKDDGTKRGNLIVNVKVLDHSFVDEPIEHDLPLTLEEILHGCEKKRKIKRLIIDRDNNETFEDKVVILEIKPGTESGSKFIQSRMGDEYPGRIPADIVFVTYDKPHDKFARFGADIEYTAKMTRNQLSDGFKLDIPTLEGDTVNMPLEKIINPNNVRLRFPGLGLPMLDDPTKRGRLIVRFEIVEDQTELKQEPPIERDLYLTDDQMRNGLTKKLKIERFVIESDGSERNESKILSIKVKPGTVVGHQFTFEKEGDIRPGIIPSDIIFIVKRKVLTKEKKENNNSKRDNRIPKQDPTIEHDLQLTLENILNSCTKKLKISRNITDSDGNVTIKEEIIEIDVKPGTRTGERFVFERKGDQKPGSIPADIVFIAKDKPHDKFTRNGVNIEYVARLNKNMRFNILSIPTLDGEDEPLMIKDSNQDVIRLPGRGLPYPGEVSKRGDLVVRIKNFEKQIFEDPFRFFRNDQDN